jgi:excisionase family DNA binding protein
MEYLMKPSEAGKELGIGKTLVFDLISKGLLESVKIGRARRVTRSGLEQYVDSLVSDEQSKRKNTGSDE